MLTGEPPYRRTPRWPSCGHTSTTHPPSPSQANPELPEAIDPVLGKGLAKNPSDRYSTAKELVDAAQQALGLSGEFAQPSRARQRRWPLVAGAVALVALAIALPLAFLGRPSSATDTSGPDRADVDSVRIDPQTNQPVAAVDIGAPFDDTIALAVGDGAVWVANLNSGTLSRVDERTNRLTSSVAVGSSAEQRRGRETRRLGRRLQEQPGNLGRGQPTEWSRPPDYLPSLLRSHRGRGRRRRCLGCGQRPEGKRRHQGGSSERQDPSRPFRSALT